MLETVFVLGLGETLKFFKDWGKPCIGVNDIWAKVRTEIIVCVDAPFKFDERRRKVIANSDPEIFFSQTTDWKAQFPETFKKIKLENPKGVFKEGVIYQSCNSPFVACSIAFNLGFKNIVLYGVDFNTHKKLKGHYILKSIHEDFTWLNNKLKERGVNMYVGHRASRLIDVLPLWTKTSDSPS
jgi:hypothetical protein